MTSPDRPVPPLTKVADYPPLTPARASAVRRLRFIRDAMPETDTLTRAAIGEALTTIEGGLDAARAKPTPEPPTGILPGMMFGTGGNDLSAAIPQPTPALDVDVLRDAIKSLGNRYPILSSDPVLGDEPDSSGNHELLELGHETWWEHGRLADAIAAQYTRLAALREAE